MTELTRKDKPTKLSIILFAIIVVLFIPQPFLLFGGDVKLAVLPSFILLFAQGFGVLFASFFLFYGGFFEIIVYIILYSLLLRNFGKRALFGIAYFLIAINILTFIPHSNENLPAGISVTHLISSQTLEVLSNPYSKEILKFPELKKAVSGTIFYPGIKQFFDALFLTSFILSIFLLFGITTGMLPKKTLNGFLSISPIIIFLIVYLGILHLNSKNPEQKLLLITQDYINNASENGKCWELQDLTTLRYDIVEECINEYAISTSNIDNCRNDSKCIITYAKRFKNASVCEILPKTKYFQEPDPYHTFNYIPTTDYEDCLAGAKT